MAKAGYDPVAMATMFAMLRSEQGRDPGKLEEFFSSHPPAADRESRIRAIASSLGTGGAQEIVGGFAAIQSRLGGVAAAPVTQPEVNTSTGSVALPAERVTVSGAGTIDTRYPVHAWFRILHDRLSGQLAPIPIRNRGVDRA